MLQLKNTNLKALIESHGGLHLSSYLKESDSIDQLQSQLSNTIATAKGYLFPNVSIEEADHLLLPLEQLLYDEELLKQLKGNFAIFRSSKNFEILKVPVRVEPMTVISSTFHVKPLLSWQQQEKQYLMIGVDSEKVYLYTGSMTGLRLLDVYFYGLETCNETTDILESLINRDVHNWIANWLQDHPKLVRKPLIIVGDSGISEYLCMNLGNRFRHLKKVKTSFKPYLTQDITDFIKEDFAYNGRRKQLKALSEFEKAKERGLALENIVDIASAVCSNKVEKLYIANDVHIFGLLNQQTGKIRVHSKSLDHEDDDILDDLAQITLKNGNEIVILPKEDFPQKNFVLAILKDESCDSKEDDYINKYFKDKGACYA